MYSNNIIIDILNYIDNNINKKITIEELSKLVNYNKEYIMRLFKKELNITIINYINNKRIYNSLNTLKYTSNSILNISLNNGFQNEEYYIETFNKIIGISPLKYKNIYNNKRISIKNRQVIEKNINNLYILINNINNYKINIKPENKKVLSIFR